MAVHTWDITWTGTTPTSAELRPGEDPGQIDVFLNTNTGSTPNHQFLNDDGMDLLRTTLSNFTFIDKVPAALKPVDDIDDDNGIKVELTGSASNGTLRIEAQSTDQYMTVTQSTSTSNTIEVTDITVSPAQTGTSRTGSGVTNLTLRTYDFPVPGSPPTPATDYYPTLATSGGGTDVVVPFLADDIFLTVDTGAARYNRIWLGTDEGFTDSFLYEEAQVITGAGRCQVTVRGQDSQPLTRARIDFGPRGAVGTHTGHNKLLVDLNGVATLEQLAGASHRVVVEEVVLDGYSNAKPSTLYVKHTSTIDDLDEFEYGLAFVQPTADGTEVPLWNVSPSSQASVEGDSTVGTFTVDGQAIFKATSAPSTVDTFAITGDVETSNGVVNVDTGAIVTALNSSRMGALNFTAPPGLSRNGMFTLQARPTPYTANNARKLIVRSLDMGSPLDGKLDLKDNVMIVDYSGSSPILTIQSLITSAYNASGTLWTGNGLGSSTAYDNRNATYKTGLGYGEVTDIRTSFPATWDGQTNINNTSVLVKYTFYGDATLDGMVNLADFNRVASDFGNSPRRWTQGDFTYDAFVGLADFNRLAANFGQSGLGEGNPADVEEVSQEELEEMWEEWTGG